MANSAPFWCTSAPIVDIMAAMSLDWNDLHYLLELERAGTVRAAAERLRIHHTTIARHLAQLQETLGVRLVQRMGRRFEFTAAGRELLETAKAVEARITETRRKLAGRDQRIIGHVRISAPESIAQRLAPQMRDLMERHPGITVDVSTGFAFKNLAQMETDLAIRVLASSPTETLIGRRLAPVQVSAYGSAALLDVLEPCPLEAYPWVGWSEHLSHYPMEAWLRRQTPPIRAQLSTDSETTLGAWIRHGAGVGFLPSFTAQVHPHLRLLSHVDVPTFTSQAWVLMHEDLKAVPRVKAVSQWLADTHSNWLLGNEL